MAVDWGREHGLIDRPVTTLSHQRAMRNKKGPATRRRKSLRHKEVETKGLEPSTPGLQSLCSPN